MRANGLSRAPLPVTKVQRLQRHRLMHRPRCQERRFRLRNAEYHHTGKRGFKLRVRGTSDRANSADVIIQSEWQSVLGLYRGAIVVFSIASWVCPVYVQNSANVADLA